MKNLQGAELKLAELQIKYSGVEKQNFELSEKVNCYQYVYLLTFVFVVAKPVAVLTVVSVVTEEISKFRDQTKCPLNKRCALGGPLNRLSLLIIFS